MKNKFFIFFNNSVIVEHFSQQFRVIVEPFQFFIEIRKDNLVVNTEIKEKEYHSVTEYLLECYFNYPTGSLKGQLEIENSFRLNKKSLYDKGFEMDIKVTLKNKILNLEAYTTFTINKKLKSLSYMGYAFSSQLDVGDNYNEIHPYLQINFVGKNIPSKNYMILSTDDTHDSFIKDYFEIQVVNIDDYKKMYYNGNERLKRLYAYMSAKNDKEARAAIKGDEMLMEMYQKSEEFTKGNWAENFFSYKNIDRMDYTWELQEARKEVAKEKTIEFAKKLLQMDMSFENIIEATGLTLQEIEDLKDDM